MVAHAFFQAASLMVPNLVVLCWPWVDSWPLSVNSPVLGGFWDGAVGHSCGGSGGGGVGAECGRHAHWYVEDVWVTGIGVEDIGQSFDSSKNPPYQTPVKKKTRRGIGH
jgi:hypothetical protein